MVGFEVHYEDGTVEEFEVEDDEAKDVNEMLSDTDIVVWYVYKHNTGV